MPYNWLLDDTGTLRIIDFGHVRWHVPAYDLTRLYFGPWWNRPHLATVFLQGYGRILQRDEQEFIQLHLAMNAANRVRDGRAQQSMEKEQFGRRRLRQLMNGHTITTTGKG